MLACGYDAPATWAPATHAISAVADTSTTGIARATLLLYEGRTLNEVAEHLGHADPGYRRIWALLRTEGHQVNRKRIERLWRSEGHRVPPRRSKDSGKRAQGNALNASWNLAAGAPNEIWSYDFPWP